MLKSPLRTALAFLIIASSLPVENASSSEPSANASITPGSGGEGYLEMSRGFALHSAFSTDQLDSVNLFNGNLVVDVPLGKPVKAGRIDYAFRAVYNSRNWDFIVRCIVEGGGCWDWAIPNVTSNSGMGWIVTLGQLYQPWTDVPNAPSWPNLSHNDWLYVSPDGGEHVLACEPAAAVCGSVWYSASLRIRLRQVSTSEMQLHHANGNVHKFEKFNWAGCPVSNEYSSCWLLTEISDAYGNVVSLAYSSTPKITITDNFGRRHVIAYQLSEADRTAPAAYQYVVDHVIVNDHSSKRQTYDFDYVTSDIYREFPHVQAFGQEPAEPVVNVPLLDDIDGPLSQDYDFGYITSGDRNSGVLDYYQVPTGGTVTFGYGAWEFPKPCDVNLFIQGSGGIPHFDNYQRSKLRGVTSRTASPGGTTTYTGIAEDRWVGNPSEPGGCQRPRWFRTTVNYPENAVGAWRKEEHYFSVATQDEGLWKRAEYGLPISKFDYRDIGEPGRVYPSAHVYACSNTGCTSYSSVYRRYATRFVSTGTFCELGDSVACGRRGSVLVAEHEDFWTDPGVYRGTKWFDFDGLGNFQHIAQYSNGFAGSNSWRHTYQDFNDAQQNHVSQNTDSITLGSGFFASLPGTSSRYSLDRYSYIEVYDDSFGERKDYCFNTQGDIVGIRHRPSRNTTTDALGVFYERNGWGDIDKEYRGFGPSSACNKAPGALTLDHDYDTYGHHTGTRIVGQDAYEMNREFDSAGNLVKTWSPSGVETAYVPDTLGRPTGITEGDKNPVGIVYDGNTATATRGELVVTLTVDGFGRPVTQTRTLPNNRVLTTSLDYDDAGNLVEVIRGEAERSWTHDALGRVLTATEVDGTVTTYSYSGNRAQYASNAQPVGTYFDAFGRTVAVAMGQGSASSSATACTSSVYDVSDRVREQTRESGSCFDGSGQTKRHVFDGRGFLTEVETPEVGTTDFSDFDVHGNPRTIDRAGTDLEMTYNPRGQLTAISSNGRLLQEFQYGELGCTEGAYCLSQPTFARRHNYIDGVDYTVETHSTYAGPAGEESSMRLVAEYPREGFTAPGEQEFTIARDFDDDGLVSELTFPDCELCPNDPVRQIDYTHEDALLVALSDGNASTGINADLLYNSSGALDFIGYFGFSTAFTDIQRRNGNQIYQIEAGHGANKFWQSGAYRYDSAGKITWIGNDSYQYDDLGRIDTASFRLFDGTTATGSYNYDVYDNLESRLTRVHGEDDLEQWLVSSSTNRFTNGEFEYDDDGNLVADRCRNYSYDALGMLVATSPKPAAPAGCENAASARYLYDADNQRILSVCTNCARAALDVNLRIAPSAVPPGGQATLSWDPVEGAETCTAFDGVEGWTGEEKSTSGGSEVVTLMTDTSFGLRCTRVGGSGADTVAGDVLAPVFSFEGPSEDVAIGSTISLTWSAVNYADECNASGGWTGEKPTTGGTASVSIDGPTTFVLECTGPGGSSSQSVFVDVDFPRPQFDATLNGQHGTGLFLPGEIAVVEWSAVQNADECTLSSNSSGDPNFDVTGPISLAGGRSVSEPLESTSFGVLQLPGEVTISCRNQYKEAIYTYSFFVHEGEPEIRFRAYPDKYDAELGYPKLQWYVWRANNCWPSGGGWTADDVGVPALPSGEFEVRPTVDTSYSFKCNGPFGQAEAHTTVRGTGNPIGWKHAVQSAPEVLTDPLRVVISWTYNGYGHDGFQVLRRIAGATTWQVAGNVSDTARTYEDSGVKHARHYEYAVRPFTDSAYGEISNILIASTPVAIQPTYWSLAKDCAPENGCAAVNDGSAFTYPSVLVGTAIGSVTFVIDNQSTSETLSIHTSLSSNDWQITDAPTSTIAPGARTFLKLGISTATPGAKVGTVTVHTSDPARPEIAFTLTRSVVAEAGKLTITQQPANIEAIAGTSPQLSVVVTGGSGDYGYEWHELGCEVSPCGYPTPISPSDSRYTGIDTATITIQDMEPGSSHPLKVRVWDKQNPDTVVPVFSEWGFVDAAEVIISQAARSRYVTQGLDASLSVDAVGRGALFYDWYGPLGEIVDDWNYAGSATDMLTIRDVGEDVAGRYSVIVRNEFGGSAHAGDIHLQLVPEDVEHAHLFGTGQGAENMLLDGQTLDVGGAVWRASPVFVTTPISLHNASPVAGVARAEIPVDIGAGGTEIDVAISPYGIAPGNGTETVPHLEFGLGHFTGELDGSYTGVAVKVTNAGVVQVVENGTDVLGSGDAMDCGWNECVVRLNVNTRTRKLTVQMESDYYGSFVAVSVDGFRLAPEADSAFFGFSDNNDYSSANHGWGFVVENVVIDIDRRPDMTPVMYLLQ